jgi:hypothetical protein
MDIVYFPIPNISECLTEDTKDLFFEECPRDTPQIKIIELLKKLKDFKLEMEHYYSFRDNIVSWDLVRSNNILNFRLLGCF